MTQKATFTPTITQHIIRSYVSGVGINRLAREIHSSQLTIRRVLTNAGITIRKQGEIVSKAKPADPIANPTECIECQKPLQSNCYRTSPYNGKPEPHRPRCRDCYERIASRWW